MQNFCSNLIGSVFLIMMHIVLQLLNVHSVLMRHLRRFSRWALILIYFMKWEESGLGLGQGFSYWKNNFLVFSHFLPQLFQRRQRKCRSVKMWKIMWKQRSHKAIQSYQGLSLNDFILTFFQNEVVWTEELCLSFQSIWKPSCVLSLKWQRETKHMGVEFSFYWEKNLQHISYLAPPKNYLLFKVELKRKWDSPQMMSMQY